MKKIIILLIMTVFSLAVFAQENEEPKYVTNSNVEKVIDKYIDQLNDGLINLSEKLEGPALQGWDMLIKQQYIKGFTSLIPWFVILLFLPFLIKSWKYSEWYHGDPSNAWRWTQIILSILCSFLLIIALFSVKTTLQCFINPEYGAIKDIIEFIK